MKIEDINFEKRGWMKLIFNERLKSNLSIDTNIATDDSHVKILVIHTQEDWAIAKQCYHLINR